MGVSTVEPKKDPEKYLRERGFGALADRMGIAPIEFNSERAIARMPVAGNTQPLMLLHGGAYVVLAETLGSMHANFLAPEGCVAVGVDLNATHTASATEEASPASAHQFTSAVHSLCMKSSLRVTRTESAVPPSESRTS